ncbi:hypothetical protein [Streptomyces sp. HM190]|nr:hypothetical protein [Streptomyces sp. HM190]
MRPTAPSTTRPRTVLAATAGLAAAAGLTAAGPEPPALERRS